MKFSESSENTVNKYLTENFEIWRVDLKLRRVH